MRRSCFDFDVGPRITQGYSKVGMLTAWKGEFRLDCNASLRIGPHETRNKGLMVKGRGVFQPGDVNAILHA